MQWSDQDQPHEQDSVCKQYIYGWLNIDLLTLTSYPPKHMHIHIHVPMALKWYLKVSSVMTVPPSIWFSPYFYGFAIKLRIYVHVAVASSIMLFHNIISYKIIYCEL